MATLNQSRTVRVLAEASNGEELLEMVEKYLPKVVITDIRMPRLDGRKACRMIKERFSDIGVIALSYFNDENLIYDMFKEGINGFLSKNTDTDEMLQTILAASKGEIYYSSNTSKALINKLVTAKYHFFTKQARFTTTDLQIIRLICLQKKGKEIAESLHLSSRTIEDHIKAIKQKMKVSSLVGIAIYALRHEMVSFSESH